MLGVSSFTMLAHHLDYNIIGNILSSVINGIITFTWMLAIKDLRISRKKYNIRKNRRQNILLVEVKDSIIGA